MSKIKYFLYLIVALLLASCESTKDNSMLWGETRYYSDFITKKYEPVRMSRTIHFDFNEDARLYGKDVTLALVRRDENGKHLAVDDVILYMNGEACSGNQFSVSPKEREQDIEFSIEFTKESKEAMHKWFLKVVDNGGFDRINNISIQEQELPLLLEWKARKNDVMNPHLQILLAIIAVLLTIMILWMVLIKPQLYSGFGMPLLYIESDGMMLSKRIKGAKRVVCTNRNKKQGIINQFFEGKTLYIQNDFFAKGDVTITPKSRDSVRVGFSMEYSMFPNVVTIMEPSTITHFDDDKKSATIKIQ